MARYNINSFFKWIREKDYGLPRITDTLCILLALTYVNNINRLTPNISQSLFYLIVIALNFAILSKTINNGVRLNITMWLFWLFMWISIIVNLDQIGSYFKAPYRTMSFILVQLVVAPFFVSRQLNYARERIFDVLNFFILSMAIISFWGRFFHFLPSDHQGYYLGCTWHSMDLAAIMGIAVIIFMHLIVLSRKEKKLHLMYIWSFVGSFLVVILSASRTTIISCSIALLGYWWSGTLRIQKVIKPAMLICIMVYVLSLVFPDAFQGLIAKSQADTGQLSSGGFLQSRTQMWNDRIREIIEYPLFGTGAHTIKYGDTDLSGQIEPGNAWLYVFSSMGVFQFAIFCSLIGSTIMRCRKYALPGRKASLILAIIVYFCLYMVGEAHITAAGEFTCIYFWLLIAVALYHDYKGDGLENFSKKVYETSPT